MNPLFIAMCFVGGGILWLLLSFIFKPLGKFFLRIWEDTKTNIKEESEEENNER